MGGGLLVIPPTPLLRQMVLEPGRCPTSSVPTEGQRLRSAVTHTDEWLSVPAGVPALSAEPGCGPAGRSVCSVLTLLTEKDLLSVGWGSWLVTPQ